MARFWWSKKAYIELIFLTPAPLNIPGLGLINVFTGMQSLSVESNKKPFHDYLISLEMF